MLGKVFYGPLIVAMVALAGLLCVIATVVVTYADGDNRECESDRSDCSAHDGNGKPKIEICHKPGTPAEHTLRVPQPAVRAHLAHGDYYGKCVTVPTVTATPVKTATPTVTQPPTLTTPGGPPVASPPTIGQGGPGGIAPAPGRTGSGGLK